MNARPEIQSIFTAALEYAARGWHVFPVPPGEKKSYKSAEHSGGRKWGASADPTEIRDDWARWPLANVGIVTGQKSGFFVIEADTAEGHEVDGIGNLRALIEAHGPLPATIEAKSPSGSWHINFRWPEGGGITNSAGLIGPGIDVRGEGGMVVGPPSVKPGKPIPYRWDNPPGLFDLADCPPWLLAMCRKPKLSEQAAPNGARFAWGGMDDTPASLGEVAELLTWIDPDAGGYQAWCDVLMALHDHTGGSAAGLGLADDWSSRGSKYRPGEVAAKWAGFTPGGGVRIGTLAQMAREGGADLSAIARRHKGRGKTGPKPELSMGTHTQLTRQDAAREVGDPQDEVELTEDGVALAFTRRFGERLRFDHDAGAWFEWTGDHWRQDGTGLAFAWCRETARAASSDGSDRELAAVRKRSFAAGVEAFARTDRTHAVRQDAWDRDTFALGVPGGAVDLRTGRLSAPDPTQGITKRAAVAPSERADCPLWLAFLKEAAGGDAEVVGFLKRWCGYCLTGDTREHALIFLYGPGGNGKSVFLNTVGRIMGDYAAAAAMDTFTSSRGDKHPTELALLRGARMVSASETEEGRAWAEARIKQMTGGDPITARFMRQDFFTYLPQFKLTIVGNHAPALANVDDAARRRFNIVPFLHRPANPDRELEAKLVAEWPAILRWMIAGAVEWLAHGLQQPESVRSATADYFGEQDMVRRWLDECCTLTPANPTHYETAADLFKSWSDYAKAAGEDVGTSKSMAPRLRRHGLRNEVRKVQGVAARIWIGVEIVNRKEAHHG